MQDMENFSYDTLHFKSSGVSKPQHRYKIPPVGQLPRKKLRRGSRADASLFILTQKFVEIIQAQPEGRIDLNLIAEQLEAKKRRIYDIINVLEGVGLVQKLKKNIIQWKGLPIDGDDESRQLMADMQMGIVESARQANAESQLTQQLMQLGSMGMHYFPQVNCLQDSVCVDDYKLQEKGIRYDLNEKMPGNGVGDKSMIPPPPIISDAGIEQLMPFPSSEEESNESPVQGKDGRDSLDNSAQILGYNSNAAPIHQFLPPIQVDSLSGHNPMSFGGQGLIPQNQAQQSGRSSQINFSRQSNSGDLSTKECDFPQQLQSQIGTVEQFQLAQQSEALRNDMMAMILQNSNHYMANACNIGQSNYNGFFMDNDSQQM